ncbi:PHP domain-containing protein [Undibacterium sp. LX40W]|uniref:PHP domain-containing protein n=1 Tax=Undibacterium nitidum TaxID=2762298 RepID=A0A923KMS6_9BURK|nr:MULTISPECIES: 3',5'-nucleoside bisphosphate phosphatase [Undibacterium]MBC3879843.1 PHP domain-containing protein [Undibacterium nitidum]MBC3891421.1 PHP domain-containing protein [Undibacterium sp. LX40W]
MSLHSLNVDLHCHSTVSDGVLSPDVLAHRAKANGVDVWALTDHDEVGGIALAKEAARDIGLQYVTGVEISVTWASKTIHIVGLNFDETNNELVLGLAKTRSGRQRRAEDMAADLARVGIPNCYEGALKYVGNPDLISRSHFARYLVEIGVSPDVSSVFKSYLADGKPGFVPHRWATLSEAVGWIRGAGGYAVVAHPGRYDLSLIAHDEFLKEFKELGGVGIEVITGSHTPDQYEDYAKVAKQYGFLASRGSDFHAPDENLPDLGQLPLLSKDLTPVWSSWIT